MMWLIVLLFLVAPQPPFMYCCADDWYKSNRNKRISLTESLESHYVERRKRSLTLIDWSHVRWLITPLPGHLRLGILPVPAVHQSSVFGPGCVLWSIWKSLWDSAGNRLIFCACIPARGAPQITSLFSVTSGLRLWKCISSSHTSEISRVVEKVVIHFLVVKRL